VRKVDLRAVTAIRELQENPRLGEWRMHAALRQMSIHLSPRTCGRIMAHNRTLYVYTRLRNEPTLMGNATEI